MKAFAKRHPLLSYFALVFLISWGGVLLVVGPRGFPLRWEQFERLGGLLYAAIFAGPCLAGIVMTGLTGGRAGFRDLLARLTHCRVGLKWYALVLVLPVLIVAASVLLVSLFPFDDAPVSAETTQTPPIAASLALSVLVGLFEEIGWTGFAVPRLLSHHAILTTGIGVGLVWGVWHFPVFWEGDSFAGLLPRALLLARLFSWLPAFRVLMVWIYDRTESLLLVVLMHTSLVATQLILFPVTETGEALLAGILALGVAAWLVVAAVAMAAGGQLSWQPPRAGPAP